MDADYIKTFDEAVYQRRLEIQRLRDLELNPPSRLGLDGDGSLIIDNLYLSNEKAANDAKFLRIHGITHIVNCAAHCERDAVKHSTLHYLQIRAVDNSQERMAPFFERTFDFVDKAIEDGGKVLVHYFVGMSRSATIVLAYLIRKRNISFDDALNLVKEKRHIVKPNAKFKSELQNFSKKFCGGDVDATTEAKKDETPHANRKTWQSAVQQLFEHWENHPERLHKDCSRSHLLWTEFRKALPEGTLTPDQQAAANKAFEAIIVEVLAHSKHRERIEALTTSAYRTTPIRFGRRAPYWSWAGCMSHT